jgi:hypothetical protein
VPLSYNFDTKEIMDSNYIKYSNLLENDLYRTGIFSTAAAIMNIPKGIANLRINPLLKEKYPQNGLKV